MTSEDKLILHTFRWFLPTPILSKEKYFVFDLMSFCKTFFSRKEYYGRRTTFDRKADFDQAVTSTIASLTVKLYPFGSFPMSNTCASWEIIENEVRAGFRCNHQTNLYIRARYSIS